MRTVRWLVLLMAADGRRACRADDRHTRIRRGLGEAQRVRRSADVEHRPAWGRYSATNMTLRMLVKTAYGGLHDNQIVGGPRWAKRGPLRHRCESHNGSADQLSRDEARVMLRSALTDRFGLEMHRERREIPVYVLLIAARDGALGPNLRRANVSECGGPAKPFPRVAADAPEPIPDSPCGSGFARAGSPGRARDGVSRSL